LKPQNQWLHLIDNTYGSFVPSIKTKPNAIQKLDPRITEAQAKPSQASRHITFGDHRTQKSNESLPHPYQPEIENFMENLPAP